MSNGLKIGFTGNRGGLTQAQTEILIHIFKTGNNHISEFHHGLCVGSDEQAHDIVRRYAFWKVEIIGHPPISKEFYAPRHCDIMMQPLPYLMRNRNIVNRTHALIAAPAGPETVRSGTWSTIRYARKQKKKITIIMPDGQVIKETN